jgi:hypothetical protein
MSENLTGEQYDIIREWASYHYGRPIADATMDDLRRRLEDAGHPTSERTTS